MQKEFLNIYGGNTVYRNVRKYCRIVKISKSTFYRWMEKPRFKKKIEEIEAKRNMDPYKPIKSGGARQIIRILKRLEKQNANPFR